MTAKVPAALYWKTRFASATGPLWRAMAKIETAVVADELANLKIEKPVYVTALARSGTTIITEFLNEHPALTSLRYSDFPWLYTPFWRNWLRQRTQTFEPKPVERAHRDRILVTQDSPEAYEEPIWMDFFPDLHNDQKSQVLSAESSNDAFETQYTNHIKKLLLVRGASRYLAKGNYNIGRIGYLLKLFPDARFIVPVRHPVNHVASLLKQHQAFLQAQRIDPRTSRQLSASGHFEFGPNRKGVHLGDNHSAQAIKLNWRQGQEIEGWARHWSMIYQYLFELSQKGPFKSAIMLLRYEDLCAYSQDLLPKILHHCDLDTAGFDPTLEKYAKHLTPPGYYQPEFSPDDLETLTSLTRTTAQHFGYEV